MDKIRRSNTLSAQTNVIKVSRLHRQQSFKHKHYHHQSKLKTQSKSAIHVNMRSTNNRSTNFHRILHSTPVPDDKTYCYRDYTQQSRNNLTSQQNSENTLNSSNSYFIKVNDSIKNVQQNMNSSINSDHLQNHSQSIIIKTKKYRSSSSKVTSYNTSSASPDRFGIINDHHRNKKRNKKKICSRRCVIISIFAALMLTIIITIILLVLLTNSKTTTTTFSTVLLRWNQTGITVAGGTVGKANNQLNIPLDVTVDYKNTLYIADYGNHRIQKILMGTLNGTTICGNGSSGSSLYQLSYPAQVLVDLNGNIRVVDYGNNRVLFYNGTSTGIIIASAGGYGTLNNQSKNPYGIEYDSASDTLYIADYNNHRVMCYVSGASSGFSVAGNSISGTSTTQLKNPVRVYFDSFSNSLIIVNHYAHNVVRWPLGATNWTLLAGDINGNLGNNATTLNRPTDVTLDPMGNMYVADRENHRIQFVMNGQTEGITIVGVTGTNGSDSTLLNRPWSVELDSQLNLYVADSNNHRIQKFLRY
ncbi:unnamed protein product [Rotaria sordida]|uniref:NHL repeat containing protein n=1 Tax=Rotaria sordida TaxID=392033 RepID=A0A815HKQ4_9BILA|nr:unnamed protein product [Rotaria sordida]CAF1603307.1 unnamed protein product [Rotaria sordida]